jgi:hypothetical protein
VIGHSEHYVLINFAIAVVVPLVLFALAGLYWHRRNQRIDAEVLAVVKETPGLSAQNIRAVLRDKGVKVGYGDIYVRLERLWLNKRITRMNVKGGPLRGGRDRVLYK